MLRLLKRVAWLGVLAAGLPAAQAFSLLGTHQRGLAGAGFGLHGPLRGDLGAPKNIGEDYRRNMPVLYYAFDETFLDYFGSNGVAAVDQAFAILNNLTTSRATARTCRRFRSKRKRFNQTAGGLEPAWT